MLGSPHFIRIVPEGSQIPPGYLYSYLSGQYGRALMREGTYGSIIVAIETHQLRDLPVPRLGAECEGRVHRLVERASSMRTAASRSLVEAGRSFDELVTIVPNSVLGPNVVDAGRLQARMDARYFDRAVESAQAELRKGSTTTIGAFCSTIFLPGIFKRLHVEDANHGVPYYTGAALFALEPEPKGYLSPKTTRFEDVLLSRDTILIQAFGQEGGLTGRAVWVGEHLEGSATTHMLVRLRCDDRNDTAYLFGFLQSKLAYAQLARLPYGGSIPHFDEHGVSGVVVPLLKDESRQRISETVLAATSQLDEALTLEWEARTIVEQAIGRGVEPWPQ
jgi:type I restriction enzyme S subunit